MSNTFLSQSDFKRTIHHTDKLRVAAYIRVSTDEDDQENSFEVQKAYFEETLNRNHHWTSAGVFSDYGITGTQKKNRAGFNRMMRKCTEGKIDRILCKSISRLAKNTADFIRTLDTLHDCGVSIYFEKENIDTTEAVSSFVLTALVMPGKRKFKLIGWTIFLMFFILLVGSVVSSGFSGNIVKLIENMLLSIIGVFSDNTSSSLSGAGHRFILWEWVYNTVGSNYGIVNKSAVGKHPK